MRYAALGIGALLYGLVAVSANPGMAADLTVEQQTTLKDMREGHMRKLIVHKEARPRVDETFRDQYGNAISLADYEGKVVVLNFWATWCPPCRAEMPSIDRLSGDMSGGDFAVLALSTDRFDVKKITDFFEEIEVQNLPVLQDRRGNVARMFGVLGLPVTVILDREGREIARLQGEAEWDAAYVKAILTRIAEMTAPEA